jgi:hypothetical protein
MVQLGNGSFGTSYNDQKVDTTVLVGDGETIAIGGLIQKRDNKSENKIPWFGDLPYIGALFRFRSQEKTKTELMVILTPHIIRSRLDADRILAEESRRMDWIIGDVIKTHGTTGLQPILPPLPLDRNLQSHEPAPGTCPLPPAPLPGEPLPSIEIVPEPSQRELLPKPRRNPDMTPEAQSRSGALQSSSASPYAPGITNGASSPPALTTLGEEPVPAITTDAPKEKEKSRLWKILHPGQ